MTESQKTLILEWLRKIHKMEWAHRYESQRWRKVNLAMGISAVILATLVSAIPNISFVSDEITNQLIPFLSIIVAILSGLQTFLKPSEISDKFRLKSDEFEGLRHQLEELAEFHQNELSQENSAALGKILERWRKIGSLNMSEGNFKMADKTVDKLNRYPEAYQLWSDNNLVNRKLTSRSSEQAG